MLPLLFIGLPFVELWLLFQIGDLIGGWPTLGLVILSGLLGATLAKREGMRLYEEIQQSLARSELPELELVSGLLLLVGGVCLVTPGVITDLFGVAMLVAPLRRAFAGVLRRRFSSRMTAQIHVGAFPSADYAGDPAGGEVIDVEARPSEAEPSSGPKSTDLVKTPSNQSAR